MSEAEESHFVFVCYPAQLLHISRRGKSFLSTSVCVYIYVNKIMIMKLY